MIPLSEFGASLQAEAQAICTLLPAQLELLESHFNLLVRWNKRLNLVGESTIKEAIQRHYCESLVLAALLPAGAMRILDYGSGAGFPGLPVGVLRQDCHVTLVESDRRKCVFLQEVCAGIPNVEVLNARAETVASAYDWVVARAVRPEEVVRAGIRYSKNIALLVGSDAVAPLAEVPGVEWRDPWPLPWGKRRVALLGVVT